MNKVAEIGQAFERDGIYYSGKYVFIKTSIIFTDIHTNIINKIGNLSELTSGYNVLEKLEKHDDNVIVLYVDISYLPEQIIKKWSQNLTLENINSIYYGCIKGFVILRNYESHASISGIFVEKSEYEVAKGLLQKINNYSAVVCLIIRIDSSMWNNIIDIALEAGFGSPIITDKDCESDITLDTHVLRLIYRNDMLESNLQNIRNNKLAINNMKQYFLNNVGICDTRIKIPIDVLEFIKSNTFEEKIEYGGIFAVKSYDNDNAVFSLDIPISGPHGVISGDPKSFAVTPPNHFITWHTHPYVCYRDLSCYIGWPSSADMALVLYSFTLNPYPLVSHLVLSGEGIYHNRLTINMMNTMNRIKKDSDFEMIRNLLYNVTFRKFSDIEQYRNKNVLEENKFRSCKDVECLKIKTDDKDYALAYFRTIASTITLRELLEWGKNTFGQMNDTEWGIEGFISGRTILWDNMYNIFTENELNSTIFISVFRDWEEIAKDNGFNDTLNYTVENIPCPLPFYEQNVQWTS